MALTAGTHLGPYEVLSPLGAGGMGEVYKGRDTRLDRIVALKVLPEPVAADAESRQRFEREARAISKLDHPHICALYDVGHQNGIDFLVMQFLEGETLGERLSRGALPIATAIDYAIQIADALDRAHRQGIVHRDLKPPNVMLTKTGVKLLDFGLAKSTAITERDRGATSEAALTQPGMVLGTMQYISPEQLEGREADPRSDIFAFGAVLYELLTGERAFCGDSQASLIASILTTDPRPVTIANAQVPTVLDRLVRRCLAKDPEQRWQSMRDVLLELRWIRENPSEPSTAARPTGGRTLMSGRHVAAVALLLAATAVGTWRLSRPEPTEALEALARLTSDPGLTWQPALSPDGKLIAYSSDRSTVSAAEAKLDIWVQQVAGGNPIQLTRDPADDREPAFSPDGSQVAYRSDREAGGIYVVPALGGESRLIATGGETPQFSPDGRWIAYWIGNRTTGDPAAPGSGHAYVVPVTGGSPKAFHPEFSVIRYPIWAPDGTRLLFWGKRDAQATTADAIDWWIAPLDGDTAVKTGAAAALGRENLPLPLSASAWMPDGRLIFAAQRGDASDLWQLRIAEGTDRAAGAPVALTKGTGRSEQPSVIVSRDDQGHAIPRLAFSSLMRSTQIWTLPVDVANAKPTGPLNRLTTGPTDALYGSVSMDGRRLVFARPRRAEGDIWVKDLQTGREVDLTPTPDRQFYPHVSADGTKISYSETKNGTSLIYTMSIASSPEGEARPGVAEKLCEDCRWAWQWSFDGTRVLFANGSAGRPDITAANVRTGEKVRLFSHPEFNLYQANASPDGKWVAFVAHVDSQHSRLFIAPFRPVPVPSSNVIPPEWIPITTGQFWDDKPRWSPVGNLLYFISNRDGFLCLWAQRLDPTSSRAVGAPFDIVHFHNASRSMVNVGLAGLEPSVARDRIVLNLGEITGNIWIGDLRRIQR